MITDLLTLLVPLYSSIDTAASDSSLPPPLPLPLRQHYHICRLFTTSTSDTSFTSITATTTVTTSPLPHLPSLNHYQIFHQFATSAHYHHCHHYHIYHNFTTTTASTLWWSSSVIAIFFSFCTALAVQMLLDLDQRVSGFYALVVLFLSSFSSSSSFWPDVCCSSLALTKGRWFTLRNRLVKKKINIGYDDTVESTHKQFAGHPLFYLYKYNIASWFYSQSPSVSVLVWSIWSLNPHCYLVLSLPKLYSAFSVICQAFCSRFLSEPKSAHQFRPQLLLYFFFCYVLISFLPETK